MKKSSPHINANAAGMAGCVPRGDAARASATLTRLPVSCFIIAKDEEDRIDHTLESVQGWASEIIVVVDDTTQDGTAERAKLHGAQVFHKTWEGYGAQKRFAESKCRSPWLLNLDADEALSLDLREEICLYFTEHDLDPPVDGMRLNIRTLRRNENTLRPFAPSNDPVRLYRRTSAAFSASTVHDSVVFTVDNPSIGKFRAPVLHRSFRSYAHAIEKINRYSDWQAQDMLARGKSFSTFRILIEPYFAFFKAYILRRYIFMGLDGIFESRIYVLSRVLRMAKLREARRIQDASE